MSVIRPRPPEDPIAYEAGLPASGAALPRARLDRLARARGDLAGSAAACLPDRLLEAYNTAGARATSEIFAILQTARRILDAVDRVIVLGDADDVLAARSILESCGHPFHNELARGERGGRPRVTCLEPPFEGDLLAGLLDLVAPPGRPPGGDLLEQWGVIVTGRDAGAADPPPATAAVARLFLAALAESLPHDRAEAARRAVMITAAGFGSEPMADPTNDPAADDGAVRRAEAEPHAPFTVPAGRGFAAALMAPGLLPAAVAGIDVVRLLQGAAAMNRRFREAPVADNPVLQYVGSALSAAERARVCRVLVSRSQQLETICRWHGGRADRGAAALPTALVVLEPRRDPLGPWLAAVPPTAARRREARPPQPADAILLPRIDEHSIGQLLQFLLLADLVEAAVGAAV